MKIRMVKEVRSDIPILSTSRTVLRDGKIYEATANKHGAVCGICGKGELIGVRPGEFEFVELPKVWFKKFCRKKNLREVCREKYGDDFVEMYDMANSGIPIGNLEETQTFLAMVEAAKEES